MISSRVSIVKSAVFMMLMCACAFAAEGDAAAAETAVKTAVNPAIYYAIAAIMGIGSISASMAVGKIGAAAMGAAAEKPELLGKAIAFVGLGEGIALFGFLISLFLVFKV
ncbi:MAG: hypothetical protein IKR81_05775 [Victivallales bacterium]|jgi:V/A-type H+-transporting ATPase subunit K|nr:hypothetical protein [Victivallales bacterium]